MEYLEGRADMALSLDGVNKLLDFIGDMPQKETIKCQLAEYIIREVIIDPILNNENIETQKHMLTIRTY